MNEHKRKKISSLVEYQRIVDNIIHEWDIGRSTLNLWFRGQDDTNWNLTPRIYRSKKKFDFERERELTRDFILYSPQYISQQPSDLFEWLFFMQHYGLPTRLLDWTESSLVALYFAVDNFENRRCDSSVWILDPWSLNNNQYSFGLASIPIYTNDECIQYLLDIENLKTEIKVEYPIAIRPKKNSPRIIAQKGMFTIHGKVDTPINLLEKDYPGEFSNLRIRKIEINKNSKLKIKKELYFSGITAHTLFPEIDGISKDLTFRFSNDFMNDSIKGI
jgi:hypothetical protein